jgi:hypothetical protein
VSSVEARNHFSAMNVELNYFQDELHIICVRACVPVSVRAPSVLVSSYCDRFLPEHIHSFCSNKVQVLQEVMAVFIGK